MTGRLNETHLLGNSYSVFIPSNLNHHFVCWPVSQDPCKVGGHPPRASPELGGVDRVMAMPNTGDGGPEPKAEPRGDQLQFVILVLFVLLRQWKFFSY